MRIVIRTKDSATLTRDVYEKTQIAQLAAMCANGESVALVDGRTETRVIAKDHPILGVCTLGLF